MVKSHLVQKLLYRPTHTRPFTLPGPPKWSVNIDEYGLVLASAQTESFSRISTDIGPKCLEFASLIAASTVVEHWEDE